ncbi:hypothetical protein B0J14DRAFT_621331 [Halenospora varia]|nr:hypothetical protein B0J14DRAFT_621331 [Halenospora varia]
MADHNKTPPIKSTKLRRFLVLAAVKILKRIRPQKGTVLFISDNLCLKFGTLKHLPEASTLQFIARNTSIPVPKVHCAFTRKGWTYIDCRIPSRTLRHGPFRNIHEFHRYLRGGFDAHPDHYLEVSRLIELQDREWPLVVFTHRDLSSLNILIRGDEIVNPQNYFWRDEIPNFLDLDPDALEMETIRQKYFGDF